MRLITLRFINVSSFVFFVMGKNVELYTQVEIDPNYIITLR